MSIERFVWSVHALERLSERRLTSQVVEGAVREGHRLREVNEGHAEWRVETASLVVLYDHPYRDDVGAARIVTAWRKRGARKRHLKLLHTDEEGYSDR